MSRFADFAARWRVRLGYPLALIFLWLARPSASSLAIGAGVAAIGLALRAAAAGRLRKRELLATSGIYAWTRNPLYLGSAILGAGIAAAGASGIAACLLVAYFAVVYPVVMRREEQELRGKYGTEFDEYARRVPLFFPRPPHGASPRATQESFSWAAFARNREWQALAGTILVLFALWLKMRFR
jgi:protein-S-isoprenylcysteine O-methyltransferase Ste14